MAISPLSIASLHLTPTVNDRALGTATGFVYSRNGSLFLITNWHVVAGRDRITGQPMHSSGATPDRLTMRLLLKSEDGANSIQWREFSVPLLDEREAPLWLEHPAFGRRVDVAALPVVEPEGTRLALYNDDVLTTTMRVGVAEWVNILGFPFGIAGGGSFAVWTKGGIATEMDVDFNDLPAFLIDSRTRPGQSGSPVITYSPGGMTAMADGSTAVGSHPIANLLGVYSGRINAESDLGYVWKGSALLEILDNGVPGNNALIAPA